jgi:hypothetical protein
MLNGQITTNDAGEKFIFALVSGHAEPLVAHQSHPNFRAISEKFLANDENGFADLFDIPKAVEAKFARLSERVTTKGGNIYFDGDEVHGTLIDAILRFMDEGEDFGPLVKFFENIASNPNTHSREQLYDWLAAQQAYDGGVSIDSDGMLVAYKGVGHDGDGSFRSISSGKAIVDGVAVEGQIPNKIGSVIEMPRSEVIHDPANACSRGLHVGTFDYAKGWASGALLRVSVNPRDVVSVPTDARGQKVRVCRYVVEDVITEPVKGALLPKPEAPETLDDGDVDVTIDGQAAGDDVVTFKVGDRFRDDEGDEGRITRVHANGSVDVEWDNSRFGHLGHAYSWGGAQHGVGNDGCRLTPITASGETASGRGSDGRLHGKGGPTSQAAKGRGRNPAQDTLGRFSAGRPGSRRDRTTGRFA